MTIRAMDLSYHYRGMRSDLAMFLEAPTVMRHKINSELIEAFSLCPRKAFLLMTGATASRGPHDYEVVIREQAEANRQAHRARLAEGGEVVPLGGPAEMAAGRL